jgi:hypothetical protein
MKHDHPILTALGAHRRAAPTVVAVAALTAPLLCASSAAVADSRGYVISWFSVATNNPDFAVNCPRTVKEQISRIGKQREASAFVDGKEVAALDYPDALQKEPDLETVVGKYAYGFDLGGPRPPSSLIPRRTRKWTTSSGAPSDAPPTFSSRRPRCRT